MTGLEKIINKIAEESAQKCDAIIDAANQQASEIISSARQQSSLAADEVTQKAKDQADRIVSAAKSSAETITRTKYLEVRNAIVNDIISAAYEEIEKLSDSAYFDLLYKLCVNNVETGECMMYLSSRDLERLPDDFQDRINGEVYEKAAVQISKEPHEIENGFILDYGDFEINCTLKAVFDENMDKLKDMLCASLFE
ncbi:MAG: V-type ATP synthase subunit E [Acutalibacteraceae bacterium]